VHGGASRRDRVGQHVEQVAWRHGIEPAQRVDGRGARQVAGRAESVGDGDQSGTGGDGVLIPLADEAGVRSGGVPDGKRHTRSGRSGRNG
jgi:hypothetical protein